MSEPPLESFEAELDALLDRERRAAHAPNRALQRVWSRLGAGLVPVGGGGATAVPRSGWLASHAVGVAAAAFVAGGVTGAAVYAAVQKPPAERIVYVDRPVPAPPIASAPPLPAAPTSAPAVPPASSVARASARAPSSESLSAERALLDQARLELGSGDAAGALALLEEHARQFKKPQLSEEREALAIQSLVALARYDEARARAARFMEGSPNSLFVPAIQAAVASIP
jgi:hypothetical protein